MYYSRILAIFAISLTLLFNINCHPTIGPKGRQYIPSVPGYIPVYIRSGDTPLEDINPDLAAAFTSYAQKHARLAFGRSLDDIKKQDAEDHFVEVKDISLVHLDEDDLSLEDDNNVSGTTKKTIVTESQHIQKIPRT